MLGGGKRESIEGRKDQALQHLRGWAKDRYWAVAGALVGRLGRFKEGDDCCSLPDGGDISVIERKVEEVGQVPQASGTQVLELMNGKSIRTYST